MKICTVTHRNPIAGVFSEDEIAKIADAYLTGPEWEPTRTEVASLEQRVAGIAWYEALTGGITVEVVDEDEPYDTAETMRQSVRACKTLQIAASFKADPVLSPEVNVQYRAAHDLHHCASDSCDFYFDGEVCALSKFLQYFDPLSCEARYVTADIIGQVAVRRVTGAFPNPQRSVLAPEWVTARVAIMYGLMNPLTLL